LKNWKYWVIRRLKPESAKKATVTEPLAALKRGLRNRLRSTIGSEVVRSRTMKAANSPAASAKPPRLWALLQPWPGASMIV
jgi:hypothetical protein